MSRENSYIDVNLKCHRWSSWCSKDAGRGVVRNRIDIFCERTRVREARRLVTYGALFSLSAGNGKWEMLVRYTLSSSLRVRRESTNLITNGRREGRGKQRKGRKVIPPSQSVGRSRSLLFSSSFPLSVVVWEKCISVSHITHSMSFVHVRDCSAEKFRGSILILATELRPKNSDSQLILGREILQRKFAALFCSTERNIWLAD